VFEKNRQTHPEGDSKGTHLLYTIVRLYRCEKATSLLSVDLMALHSKHQCNGSSLAQLPLLPQGDRKYYCVLLSAAAVGL
jgi:hypothetical protein